MQMHTLILSVALVSVVAGCKNKKELPEAGGKTEAVAPAPQHVEPVETTAAAQQDHPMPDSLYFSLERTPCFGSCPTYKVIILQDGSATYNGRRFAAREGKFTGHVDAAVMAQLAQMADKYGFYGMDAKYDRPVTDLPSVIIRINAGHGEKQVIGRVGSPQAFKEFTKEAEKLLDTVVWTKVEEGEH